MVTSMHEKSRIDVDAPVSDKRTINRVSGKNSRSLDRSEDCCVIVARGGATARVDKRCVGTDSNELKPMDSWSKQARDRNLETQANFGKAESINIQSTESVGKSFGESSTGVWVEPRTLGWPHSGCSSETPIRSCAEGSASPNVDASGGLSNETGQPCVSSRSCRRRDEVPSSDKKNSKRWGRVKPLSSRMNVVLLFIRKWGEVGRRLETA